MRFKFDLFKIGFMHYDRAEQHNQRDWKYQVSCEMPFYLLASIINEPYDIFHMLMMSQIQDQLTSFCANIS